MQIRWKLNDVMISRSIRNAALAEELDLTVSAVSRRRKAIMPRLDGWSLESLIMAIEKLSGESIAINDLIEVER